MRRVRALIVALTFFGSVSCAGRPPPSLPPGLEPGPAQPNSPPQTSSKGSGNATIASVHIAPEIREACGISTPEAYFAFDSTQLTDREDRILEKLAQCFIKGALFGHKMALVGHADPRGDEEYNLLLGGRRADAVRTALVQKGLDTQRVQTTSRGEYDAKGVDEPGWRQDRRVDVLLAD